MRHLTSHRQMFRQGGTLALLLVSACPLAAQTPPSSPPSAEKAILQSGSTLSLREIEREMKEIEARIRARGSVKTTRPANAQKSKILDPDRKRFNWLRSYLY